MRYEKGVNMKLRNCTISEFVKRTEYKTVICFGSGKVVDEMSFYGTPYALADRIGFIIDNNKEKWNTYKILNKRKVSIKSPDEIKNYEADDIAILLTLAKYEEVIGQIEEMEEYRDVDVYIYYFIKNMQEDELLFHVGMPEKGWRANADFQIPKVLHYTWFSGEEMPDDMKYCIDSWYKFCSDYTIKEWNMSNYDVSKNQYMYDAFKTKKWGFIADYARLDIIYREGGIYLDTDVEVIKNLDELRYNSAFISYQSLNEVNAGSGFGAVPNHPAIKAMRDEYNEAVFYGRDLMKNPTSPYWQTKTLKRLGLRCDGGFQVLGDLTVYPREFLCVKSLQTGLIRKTENSYTIHHFAASWLEEKGTDKRKILFEKSLYNEGNVK